MSTTKKGKDFEREIKKLYELMGYDVKQNQVILEHEVDLLIQQKLSGDFDLKLAVECKFVAKGNLRKNEVMDNLNNYIYLRAKNQIQGIIIVTTNGFAASIYNIAKEENILLLTLNELRAKIVNSESYLKELISNYENDQLSKYYVELDAKTLDGIEDKLENFINFWLIEEDSGVNLFTILGEYGTGKTSFCKKLAHKLAVKYFEDPINNRIPLLFYLRQYADAPTIQPFITNTLVNEFNFREMNFKLFEELNKIGKFFLIFDGFDEMSQKVTFDKSLADFDKITNLASFGKAKVIVTCRREFFKTTKEERELLLDESQHDMLYVMPFNEIQISEFIQKIVPLIKGTKKDFDFYKETIFDTIELYDMATRPVLLNLIVNYLPKIISQKKPINIITIFDTIIEKEIKRRITIGRALILREDRIKLIKLLAMWMFSNNIYSISYHEIPEKIDLKKHFDIKTRGDIEIHLHDFLVCSFLNRPIDEYQFSHNTFVEYFVAKYITECNEKERNEIFDNLLKSDDRYMIRLMPFATKEIFVSIIKRPEILMNRKFLWFVSWFNYNNLENVEQIELSTAKEYLDPNYENDFIEIINNSIISLTCSYFGIMRHISDNFFNLLPKIMKLSLSYCKLRSLPNSFDVLTELQLIDLSNNHLKELPESIGSMENLKTFYLQKNYLLSLPKTFEKLTNVTELNMSKNNLNRLSKCIFNMTNLEILDISSNYLTVIPDLISNLKKLDSLTLSNNKIKSISSSIGQLNDLRRLYLSNNKIKSLPESIGELSNLKVLDLSFNKISELPESFYRLDNLIELHLNKNPLNSISDKLFEMRNLKKISLDKRQVKLLIGRLKSILEKAKIDISIVDE